MLSSNASQPEGVVVNCIGEYDTELGTVKEVEKAWGVREVFGTGPGAYVRSELIRYLGKGTF